MNIYDFNIKSPNGVSVHLDEYRGKVILIVNTATKCGLTPQFEELETLHLKYKDEGLIIIGMPCNQFLNQEPETNESMVESCKINHGVTFLLTEKINVNGNDTHPVFNFLKKSLFNFFGQKIKWNFTKFLIDNNGVPYKRYSPTTKPLAMETEIRKLLNLD